MKLQQLKIIFTIFAVFSAFTCFYFSRLFFSSELCNVVPYSCFDNSHVKFNDSGYIDKSSRWRIIGLTTYVFTAYLDDREPLSLVITVLGFGEKREFPFNGTLVLKNGTKISLGKYKNRMVLNPYGKYIMEKLGPYAYLWPLPEKLNYTASYLKSIIVHRTYAAIGKVKADIPITFPEYSTKTFGVCIGSPLFGYVKPQTVIENIEINKILGAEFFTFYIYTTHQTTLLILEDYAREGTVEVVLNWGHDVLGQFTHYHGQTLSINECAYRNMHRVKYLVYTDLDEFIVPHKSLKWASMITKIENVEFGTYLFKHVYFFSDSNDTSMDKSVNELELSCNGLHRLELPSFLTRKVRSGEINSPGFRSKYITMPLYTSSVGVHVVFKHRGNIKTYVVPSDFALLHHYRISADHKKLLRRVPDGRASVIYKKKIVDAMKQNLCRLYGSETVRKND